MILGNDISEFQGQINWPTYKENTNFVIMKATEGIGLIDAWFGNNRQQARNYQLLRGFYHFAHPDLGNSAEAEANYFCNLIDGNPILQSEILALDFEVTYSDPVTWSKEWLDAVTSHYNGTKPFIYLNQALCQDYDWTPVINAGYALWIADYTGDPTVNYFNGGAWQTAAIQQWTDSQTVPGIEGGVDGDAFFGTVEQFQAYGYQPPTPKVTSSPTPVPTTPESSAPTPTVPEVPVTSTTPLSQPNQTPPESVVPSEPVEPEPSPTVTTTTATSSPTYIVSTSPTVIGATNSIPSSKPVVIKTKIVTKSRDPIAQFIQWLKSEI